MHELTDKLWANGMASSKIIDDNLICTYLAEKAKELDGIIDGQLKGHYVASRILGLSPSKEVEPECECMKHGKPGYAQGTCPACIEKSYKSKPKDSEVWCEHCKWSGGKWWFCITQNNESAMSPLVDSICFCGVCGTPRPKPKTLAEKFLEYSKDNNYPFYIDRYYKDLANIAEQHFKESKGC